ncbi:MAG: hypothetical protein U1F56_12325 [Rubrivivax sp.]
MSAPKPATTPTLPAGHPLQVQLARWVELRDQLTELTAKLEYVRLMARLEQRRR